MNSPQIAVTIRSFKYGIDLLSKSRFTFWQNTKEQHLTEDELVTVLSDAYGAIAGTEHYTQRVIENAPRLKVISRVGIGIDSIDLVAAKRRDISICRTLESPVKAVAEHALALLFGVCRGIGEHCAAMRTGVFKAKEGLLISGKDVGIVGFGRIGKVFAKLIEPFANHIRFYDPYLEGSPDPSYERVSSLEELVRSSDILSLHASLDNLMSPLLNESVFAQCKKGAVLINTARGGLIDEPALAKALDNGILAGAGLDVYGKEPYSGELLKYPQVITTPHVSSNTRETRMQMEVEAVRNLLTAMEKLGDY